MNISENSRIWIYQSDRALSAEEQVQIQEILKDFTSQWLAHGNQLAAGSEIRNDRFIILSVDEQLAGASGCSIDQSVKLMQEIEQRFGISLFDRFNIAYRVGNEIRTADRAEFEDLIRTGVVTPDTIVYNNLVQTRKQLETNWKVPFKESWHAQVFG
ncbi:MAG TPA: ABC transporter ATPase [Sphingobacteriaceae bacterium]